MSSAPSSSPLQSRGGTRVPGESRRCKARHARNRRAPGTPVRMPCSRPTASEPLQRSRIPQGSSVPSHIQNLTLKEAIKIATEIVRNQLKGDSYQYAKRPGNAG